jgi:hypothetical protein
MPWRNTLIVFVAGLLAGVVATIAQSGGHPVPRAMA